MARRVLALAFLGLALAVCVAHAASESLTNRTGRTATAVTVTFSEQVRITNYDSTVFPTQEPSSRSETFRFSGGQLENGARFSVSWTPSGAEITSTEWETTGAASSGSAASSTQLTYEQIMAQITHYPGPDEPLYVPAEGEQIWLTDLEGHADIYDNDSIKINYAPGFDKSQISRIDVYRNGVKMRFLPALFDVLTNAQMKTFDGNPAENSPASSHTDHAIFGYQYSFRFYAGTSSTPEATFAAEVKSGIQYQRRQLWAYIGNEWEFQVRGFQLSDQQVLDFFSAIREAGFRGIQLGVTWFVDGRTANTIIPQYAVAESIHPYLSTATDVEVRRMLRLVEAASLDCYFRVQVVETARSQQPEPYWRGSIEPQNLDLFFRNYGDVLVHYAEIAQQGHVEVYCPIVEMNSLDRYGDRIRALLTRIGPYFDGLLAVDASLNHYLSGFNTYDNASRFEVNVGKYYDWVDQEGRPLLIETSCWEPRIETQKDQRLSHLVTGAVDFWEPAVAYFSGSYPASSFGFGELGVYNKDGEGIGAGQFEGVPDSALVRDDQEFADIWAAYLVAAEVLGMDSIAVWVVTICPTPWLNVGQANVPLTSPPPAINVIHALVGG